MSPFKVFFIIVIFPLTALAEDFRILQEIPLSEDQKAMVVAREQGHVVGQNFQVELRVNCGEQNKNILDWTIVDSFSVCDLNPESLVINSRVTAIAMKTKMVDLKDYNNQIERGVASPEPRCQKPTKIKKFSLRHLCHN